VKLVTFKRSTTDPEAATRFHVDEHQFDADGDPVEVSNDTATKVERLAEERGYDVTVKDAGGSKPAAKQDADPHDTRQE
jgi:hypothetical protein